MTSQVLAKPQIRFADHPAMLMVGIRQQHSNDRAVIDIPQQWQQFKQQCQSLIAPNAPTFGVICGGNADGFEYMCGVEVASFDDAPSALGRIKIPAQHYAVFTHSGEIATIGDTWKKILSTWMAELSLESAHTPDFERYDDRYNPQTNSGDVDIWVSVIKKA
jgi:AraC family transcriptional regulator